MPCSSLRTRQNMTESSYFFYIHDVPLKKLYLLKPKFCLKKILFLKSILFLVSEKVAGKNIWVTFYKFNFFFNYFFKVYLQRLLHICITHICLYLCFYLFMQAPETLLWWNMRSATWTLSQRTWFSCSFLLSPLIDHIVMKKIKNKGIGELLWHSLVTVSMG